MTERSKCSTMYVELRQKKDVEVQGGNFTAGFVCKVQNLQLKDD